MSPRVIGGPGGCLAMATIVVENEHTGCRRQIAVLAFLIDLRDEVLDGHAFGGSDFLKPLPERVFQGHAGLASGKLDRSFDYRRGAVRLPGLCHSRHSEPTRVASKMSRPRPTHSLHATLLAEHD